MKIAIANDHAAVACRDEIVRYLRNAAEEVLDFGVESEESVDYPDQAEKAVLAVQDGRAEFAVLVCGTGIGMSIAANKVSGIRCALCTDDYSARMARAHNNANVLALRARRMDIAANCSIIDSFLNTAFEGGRHQRRIDKITRLEQR